MQIELSTKKCSLCKKVFPTTSEYFQKLKTGSFGLSGRCKKCCSLKKKEYRQKNLEKVRALEKASYERNREGRIQQAISYEAKRMKSDNNYRLLKLARDRIRKALRGNYKSSSSKALLGCSIEKLWDHLSRQFEEGMSKENYGEWHVDHIRPCSSFDLSDPMQQKKCFHYTNLQPLWAFDNLSKGARHKKAAHF